MLWTLIAVLLVLWLLGLIGGIGAGFIHLLLAVGPDFAALPAVERQEHGLTQPVLSL